MWSIYVTFYRLTWSYALEKRLLVEDRVGGWHNVRVPAFLLQAEQSQSYLGGK